MNKKFLSAILFGALMVTSTGTFVSCKDYDDDIENLQTQIDANKTDLSAKVAAVESSVSSLQSAQASLQSAIAEAKTAAEKAALEAQANAIAAAQEELAAAKTELEAAIAELQKGNEDAIAAVETKIAETEAAIATVKGNVEALQAFQTTTEAALEALAAADAKLSTAIAEVDAKVVANAAAIGKLETAVAAQVEALEKYVASNDEAVAANKSAIETTVADLKNLQDVVAGLKFASPEELAAATEAITAAQAEIAKHSTAVAKINEALEIVSAAVYEGVTHVSLVASIENDWEQTYVLDYETIVEQNNVFGKNETSNPMTFKEGTQIQRTASFLVRVSPTNAQLTEEMITLQNSLGEKLDIVSVKKVNPYTELLTARTISASGLWEITTELTALTEDFDSYVYENPTKKTGTILYAVAVNNTKDNATRNVISTYDLTLDKSSFEPERELLFKVDEKDVAEINNRYNKDSKSLLQADKLGKLANEYIWADSKKEYPTPAVAPIYNDDASKSNVVLGDNRSDKYAYPAIIGEPIKISAYVLDEDGKEVEAKNIKAMYAVLDKANAVESAPSELNAWNSYDYTGLNTVVEDTELKITVSPAEGQTIIDEYIGFRVYAVNHDGTLVDPDGKAFYIHIGHEAEVITPVAGEVIAEVTTTFSNVYSKAVEVEGFAELGKVTNIVWKAEGLGKYAEGLSGYWKENAFKVSLMDEDGKEIYNTKSNTIPTDLSKVVKAEVAFNTDKPGYVLDKKAYAGTLTIYGENNRVIATMKATATKTLPTAPANFSVKDNQIINGVYNCYLLPTAYSFTTITWDATNGWTLASPAKHGTMNMYQVFNHLDENYVFTFAGVKYDTTKKTAVSGEFIGEEAELKVESKYIDSKTENASIVAYNFEEIRCYEKDGKVLVNQDYTPVVYEFKTVYSCYMQQPAQTFRWLKAEDITGKTWYDMGDGTWNTKKDGTGDSAPGCPNNAYYDDATVTIPLNRILGVSTYNSAKYGVRMSDLNGEEISVVSAKITSNVSKEEDYFINVAPTTAISGDIVLTKNSTSTNPKADVASTLTITYIDMYGHVQNATFDFTVKKQ